MFGITVAEKTIAELLKDAAAQLVSSDSPRLDAEVLLAHVLKQSRRFFYAHPEFIPESAQLAQFSQLLAQRIQGVPVAHLTGTREFWSLPLKVTADTLIPRPDTERLVELVLECCSNRNNLSLLDLGTGTGAIALALANEKPDWKVTGVDVIENAVALAKENAERLDIQNVQFIHSDWFSAFAEKDAQRFDIIVSNPPYIAEDDEHLQQGDVRFEPRTALVAEQNGLADIEKIIIEAKMFLHEDGYLFLEHGWQQAESVQKIFAQNGFDDIKTWQDYGGNDRVSYGVFKSAVKGAITIKGNAS